MGLEELGINDVKILKIIFYIFYSFYYFLLIIDFCRFIKFKIKSIKIRCVIIWYVSLIGWEDINMYM